MNRRDLLLQQMGISQWQLRRPNALKGAVNVSVENHIKLIVVAESAIESADHFVQDLLRALELSENACLFIDFAHLQHLNLPQNKTSQNTNFWLLTENQEKIDRSLPQLKGKSLWKTPSLPQLKKSPKEKRHLWRQIQQSAFSIE